MSHLSKVQVAIRDIDVLGEALRAIGLRRVAEVPENYEFAGTFNTCDVIAVNAVNRVMARPSSIPISNPAISKRPGMNCCKSTLCCSCAKLWNRRANSRCGSRKPCPMAPSASR